MAEEIALARLNMGPISNLAMFDLRNGEVGAAVSLLTKAAIADSYKWVPVGGINSADAMRYVDLYVRSAYTNFTMHPVNTHTAEIKKRVAIVLGVARAAMTALYRLEVTDLIPGETLEALYTVNQNVVAQNQIGLTLRTNLTAAVRQELEGNLDLSEDDRAVMSDLVLCAAGIPPVQGASLMATGHHYLSDVKEKSRALYSVIERQFWKKDPIKTWVADNMDIYQDALWHKAGHPINMVIKYRMAIDPGVPEKLRKAGAGSAASRLPAKESVLKSAETVRTLLMNVRQFFTAYGGELNMDLIDMAIDAVMIYIPSGMGGTAAEGEVGNLVPGAVRGQHLPQFVTSRETALAWLDEVVKRNMDSTAMAFGFFEALSEATMGANASPDQQTLLGANSLQKLRSQCFASYTMGKEAYGDYRAFKAAERQRGAYTPIKIEFT